jgi:hypothetical protein
MARSNGERMAKASERAAKATERAASALRRNGGGVRSIAGPRTAGDLIHSTVETLAGTVGMTKAQADALEADFVASWRRHFDALHG